MRKLLLALFIFYLFIAPISAINTKNIVSLEAEIIKSGVIHFTGTILTANLRLYIPQEGLVYLEATGEWEYTTDELGNKMISIHWSHPNTVENYKVVMKVRNYAKFFSNKSDEWPFVEKARKETPLTEANQQIREWSYGDEATIDKVVRLMRWIDQNLKYERGRREGSKSAIWTWENRKGACGEFSNLLTAGLRSQGIPVRYIAGYAISNLRSQEEYGHAWVEVYIDGRWVPFDPTWLEGGYLDAAHIKMANLLDSNSSESIVYTGDGDVEWVKNPTYIRVLNYTLAEHTTLNITAPKAVKGNSTILVSGVVGGTCELVKLTLSSCVGENRKPLFSVHHPRRMFWVCGKRKIFWLLSAPKVKENYIYTCPITLQDQYHSQSFSISVSGYSTSILTTIDGPEDVGIWEEFELSAMDSGIFFSPNLTDWHEGQTWKLTLPRPGKYIVNFYSDGKYGEKTINVRESKEFQIISVVLPKNVTKGETFPMTVKVKNLTPSTVSGELTVLFMNQTYSKQILLGPNEVIDLSFNLTAYQIGREKVLIEISGKSLTSYSTSVYVIAGEEQFPTLFQKLSQFLEVIVSKLTTLFSSFKLW